jgi:isopenicillin N synthase-like dioxygenase
MNVLTIDYLSSNAQEQLDLSFRKTGFAVLKNHPIDAKLIEAAYRDWMEFFQSTSKLNYLYDNERQEGYFPFRIENAKDSKIKDLKEFFHIFPETTLPLGISDSTRKLMNQLNAVGLTLLSWIQSQLPSQLRSEVSMPLEKMAEGSHKTLFRILHYPGIEGPIEEGAVRAAPHEDINLITILCAATHPGLQVKSLDGQWHDVPCNPHNLVINSGDMLKCATQGRYPSTTHQVINPIGIDSKQARFSMPLFIHPRPDVLLAPNLTAGAYLESRLIEIGLKK